MVSCFNNSLNDNSCFNNININIHIFYNDTLNNISDFFKNIFSCFKSNAGILRMATAF